ncbi:MAG TPA: expansin EXLX1 family cellulose-binding protein [Kofleriaceae bacterium]
MARILCICLVLGCGGGDDSNLPGGSCSDAPAEAAGEGTYYDADGTGNCSFDATPNDLLVAAMNAADYNNAAWCGACLEVSGPTGKVVVRVVDQCPGCAHGDLDLSPEAFAMLSPLSAGRVPITWHEVACNVTGPIAYHFKDGANAYWTAIQIRNHRYPIATVEAMDGSGWRDIPRVSYNYFVEESGLGSGPYTLRVTDTRGHVVEDAAVALGDNVTRIGGDQFPLCP